MRFPMIPQLGVMQVPFSQTPIEHGVLLATDVIPQTPETHVAAPTQVLPGSGLGQTAQV
jgi:hypothetical protein